MNLTELTLATQRQIELLFGACAFADPVWAMDKCSWLTPETIIDEKIRIFWGGLQNGHKGDAAGAALEAGCFAELSGAIGDVPNLMFVDTYAKEIQRRAWLVSQDKHLAELMEARRRHDIEGMQAILRLIGENAPTEGDSIPTAETVAVDFQEFLSGDMSGDILPMQIPPLDKALGGLERRKMVMLAARPSMGKSTLAWQIARNVAINRRVIYFSNEMTARQLWAKAACGKLRIQWRDVIGKRITAEQLQALRDASNELMCLYEDRLSIDDRTIHTTETIWRAVAANHPALVVVDVIANLKNQGESELRRLATIARGLRDMCKDLNCALLTLHHTNRGSENRDNHRPTLADLRDCGDLEQLSDVVIFLYSPDYYRITEGMKPPRYLETSAIIAKDREGARNVDNQLAYDTESQWFEPASVIWPNRA